MALTDKQRLARLERAVAEVTRWVRGDWQGRTAAGQILNEQRQADSLAAEREERIRAEAAADLEARLADEGVKA
jgi:hypothetical protein